MDHSFRMSRKFNGKQEHHGVAKIISKFDTLAVLDDVRVVLGKQSTSNKQKMSSESIR